MRDGARARRDRHDPRPDGVRRREPRRQRPHPRCASRAGPPLAALALVRLSLHRSANALSSTVPSARVHRIHTHPAMLAASTPMTQPIHVTRSQSAISPPPVFAAISTPIRVAPTHRVFHSMVRTRGSRTDAEGRPAGTRRHDAGHLPPHRCVLAHRGRLRAEAHRPADARQHRDAGHGRRPQPRVGRHLCALSLDQCRPSGTCTFTPANVTPAARATATSHTSPPSPCLHCAMGTTPTRTHRRRA